MIDHETMNLRKKLKAKEKSELALCLAWADVPVGTEVVVTRDDGSEMRTKTRSEPWMLGSEPSRGYKGHTAVILVEGITGGYCLTRLRKAPKDAVQEPDQRND